MPDLYLYDPEFDAGHEKQKATGLAGISEKPQPVEDWGGLAAAIRKQGSIRHLALSFHGVPGGMIVGDEGKDLTHPDVKALFTANGAKPPRIETIRFLGCNMGDSPAGMAAFGAIFGASQVIGFTWFLTTQPVTFNLPKGTDAGAIDKAVAPFLPYLVGQPPAAKVIATTITKHRAHKLELVACYGTLVMEPASTLPIPERESRTRKPWTKAEKLNIAERDIAKTEQSFAAAPILPYHLITVTLAQAATAPVKPAVAPPRAVAPAHR